MVERGTLLRRPYRPPRRSPRAATLLATGGYRGALGADDEPDRLGRRRDRACLPRRRRAGRPGARPVPPDVLATNGLLLSEALRGEGALLVDDEGGASPTSSRRATSSPARGRPRHGLLDLRPIDRARFPSLMERLAREGLRPWRRADPGRRRPRTTRWAGSRPTSTGAPRSKASTRPVSARARASTARTGSPRTRCSSASSSRGGRRSLRLLEPAVPARAAAGACRLLPPDDPELRQAMWEHAGLIRDAAGLERLRAVAAPARTAGRRERARPRGEPRRALPRRLPRRRRCLRRAHRPAARQPADLRALGMTAAATRMGSRPKRSTGRPRSARGGRRQRRRHEPRAVVRADAIAAPSCSSSSAGVVCGLEAARRGVPRARSRRCGFEPLAADGDRIDDVPAEVARVRGPARALLTGERTALNLLGRLSGIATLTRRYVDAVDGTGARSSTRARRRRGCASSRSTRSAAAAARNHRFGLDDGDPDQGQPPPARRRRPRRGRARSARPARTCRSRSRRRRSTTSARRSTPAPTSSCSTT